MKGYWKKNNIGTIIVCVIIIWYLIAFIVYPLMTLFFNGVLGADQTFFRLLSELFSSPNFRKSMINTIIMSLTTAVTVNILSIFKVAVTEIFHVKGASVFRIIFLLPLIYNGIYMVSGYRFLYGSSGIVTKLLVEIFPGISLTWFSGFFAVLAVHTLYDTIYHQFLMRDSIHMLDNSLIESARAMGTSNFRIFYTVILPHTFPSIIISSVFCFVSTMASNSVPTFLGGKSFKMITQTIRTLTSSGYTDMAAIISLLLGIISIALLTICLWFQKRNKSYINSKIKLQFKKLEFNSRFTHLLMFGLSSILSVIYIAPVIVTIIYSFSDIISIQRKTFPKSFSLNNYINLLSSSDTLKPLFNSLFLSFVAILIVFSVTVVIIYFNTNGKLKIAAFFERIFALIWMIPAIIIALSYVVAYPVPKAISLWIVSSGSNAKIFIAYSIIIINMFLLSIKSTLSNFNISLIEASRSLGRSSFVTFWRITFPLLLPSIISAATLAIINLLSEFTISEFLYTYHNITLSIMFRSEFTNPTPNATTNSLVYATLLILISGILVCIGRYFNSRLEVK